MDVRRLAYLVWIGLATVAADVQAGEPDPDEAYGAVTALQKAGQHQKALKLLDRRFGKTWPVRARILRAESLQATGHAGGAFSTLAKVKDDPSVQVALATAGAALPPVRVHVASTPAGARLEVDGKAAGETPADAEVTPGFHEASFSKAGYATATERFFVEPKTELDVSVELTMASSRLEVEVDVGGTLDVGGTRRDVTRGTTVVEVPAGDFDLVLYDSRGAVLHREKGHIDTDKTAHVTYRRAPSAVSSLPSPPAPSPIGGGPEASATVPKRPPWRWIWTGLGGVFVLTSLRSLRRAPRKR